MNFKLEIITPKGLYTSVDVESLTLKLTSGYRTILAKHAPLIGSLAYAPMHYVKDGKIKYFALHGGAINVTKEKVILIVNSIEAAEDIDIERAKNAKKRAEERIRQKDDNIDVKRAELALLRALARIDTYSKK